MGGERTESVEDLAERGALADARRLLERLPPEGTQRSDALDALKRILARATPAELLRFESEGRSAYGWWSNWHGVDPRALAGTPIAMRMLATFHPSGYVREDAVKSLAGEEEALPYLLLRLNDWVEPVAISAERAVDACLARAGAAAVIRCLPIVERLRSARRRALHAVLDSIERSVTHPSALPALREAFSSGSSLIRRACVLYAARLPPDDALSLLVPLTADRDSVVASRATEALVRIVPPAALQATAGPLLRSPIGKVRLVALSALLSSSAVDLDDALRRALFDTTAAVRELARFELRRRGAADFVSSYAAALRADHPAILVPALCGLRECGAKADASLALPFASHRRAQVRAAAIRALGKLNLEGSASTLEHALEDPSPRVIRMACEALRGHAHLLDRPRLRSLLEAGSPRTATVVLGLLCEEGYWAGLEVALNAVQRDGAAIRSTALAQLAKLVAQQVYTAPPNLEAIKNNLDAASEHLPAELQRRLKDSLAAAGHMN
jgi:HEAT repeat protein